MNEANTIFALLAAIFAIRYVWYRTTQMAYAASVVPQEMSDDSYIAGFRAPLPRHTADDPILLISPQFVSGDPNAVSFTSSFTRNNSSVTTRQRLKETVLRMSAVIRSCHRGSVLKPCGSGPDQSPSRSTPLSGLRAGEPPFWALLLRRSHLFHARALRPLLIQNLNSLFSDRIGFLPMAPEIPAFSRKQRPCDEC